MIDLERLRRGDRAYLEELVRAHERLVYNVARAHATDADHAADLFQETWKHVLEKCASYRGHGSFEAWVYRVATNVCMDDHRVRRVRHEAVDRLRRERMMERQSWKNPELIKDTQRQELHRKLHLALASLPTRQHEAIFLRVLEGKTTLDVARSMRIREATVRSLIRHGVNNLRELLEGE